MTFAPRLRQSLACLLIAAAAPLAAQGPSPQDTSFWPIGSYTLELDGAAVEAEFFHSKGIGTILLHTPELSQWVELHPRGRRVVLYPPAALHRNVDGSYDRLPSPPGEPAGSYELVDHLPRFSVEGRQARLAKRPDLLGPRTAEEITAYDPSYRTRAQGYRPNPGYLSRLQGVEEPVTVKVLFGTWCSVCAELLPHLIKVEELLADTPIRIEYYGIPQDFDDPEARRLDVRSTPTGIVYLGGEEIQRITGYSWRFPELALHNVLLSVGKLP